MSLRPPVASARRVVLRCGALAFATNVVAGVAQVSLLRELTAYHGLASSGLAVRLVIAAILCAYGIGAALARYDLIVYERSFLASAHPSVSVSAENHLYTREGMAAALGRLREDGVGLVLFAGPEHALERVADSLRANGAAVMGVQLAHPDTLWWSLPVLVFARHPERVAEVVAAVTRAAAHAPGSARAFAPRQGPGPALSDARPFLYSHGRTDALPSACAVLVGLVVLALALLPRGERATRAYFFAIGVAFMLVQHALLARLRSMFGDPVATAL